MLLLDGLQGLKFTIANVQFFTGSRTFAPKKNNIGANLLLQRLAHFHNKYIFCSLLDTKFTPKILDLGAELLLGKKFNFEA